MFSSIRFNLVRRLKLQERMGWMPLAALLASGLAGCEAHSAPTAAALAADLSIEQGPSLAYRFTPGERVVYRLHYDSTSDSDIRALFKEQKPGDQQVKVETTGSAQSARGTVEGDLMVTVINQGTDRVLLAYNLSRCDARLTVNGKDLDEEAGGIETDLRRIIFVEITPQGRVLSLRFDSTVSRMSKNLARALISATQFVLPPSSSNQLHQWKTEEESTAGRYVASYEEVLDSNSPGTSKGGPALKTIRKTTMNYLTEARKKKATAIALPVKLDTAGHLTARFDLDRGCLASIEGSESRAMVLIGARRQTISKADLTLHMHLVSTEALSAGEFAMMKDAGAVREKTAEPVSLYAARSEQESQEAVYRNELGNANLASLLDDLAAIEASSDQDQGNTALYLKLKAIIFLHPESSGTFSEILTAAGSKGKTMQMLSEALGAVGNPEAQEALIKAIRARSGDWPALARLIPALGLVPSPTEHAENTLRDLAKSPSDEIASTAQLSLGVMARNLAEESPSRAGRIVEWALKELEAARSVESKKQMLLVLGNAGSAAALPSIGRFTSDPDPALRAAAESALRWIESSEAEAWLLKAVSSDAEASVRLEAAVALGFREMSGAGFAQQKSVFLSDKDEKVRLAILNNLWKSHEAFPEVCRLLKESAVRDASKDIRKAAAQFAARCVNQ